MRTQTRQHYENPGKNSKCRRKVSSQSFLLRTSVVAKLKKAQQPWHHIVPITGHANEVDEGQRRTLSHIISGYSKKSTTRSSETLPSSSSLSVPSRSAVFVLPSSASPLSSAAAFVQQSVPTPTYQTSFLPTQGLVPVDQRLDNAIHWINRYPADKC